MSIKNICVLYGSPRKQGNTNSLAVEAVDVFRSAGANVREFHLYDMEIKPCIACRYCQQDQSRAYCVHEDDMQSIFDATLDAELVVLATPIYGWFCTAPMKAALDRLIYSMDKYYGDGEIGPALLDGTKIALIITCGYKPEKGGDLFEEGMKRYAKHSHLEYVGMLGERHLGYGTDFMDEEKAEHAQEFARKLLEL